MSFSRHAFSRSRAMIPNRFFLPSRLAPVAGALLGGLLGGLLVLPGPLAAQQATPAQKPTPARAPATTSPAAKAGAAKVQPKADPKKTDAKATAPAPGGGQASLLASFGDWGAYATQGSGKARICYALSQPKDRQPKTLTRDPGYLFVSFRPGENVKNEIALMMGFPTKDGGAAEAVIGSTTYALVTKDQNAWVKNPSEEAQVVATMAKGQNLVVKTSSKRGNQSTDRYSLNGFGPALERVRKECP